MPGILMVFRRYMTGPPGAESLLNKCERSLILQQWLKHAVATGRAGAGVCTRALVPKAV